MTRRGHFHASKAALAVFVRNFVFGVEDSLVSTAGLLSGLAVAHTARETIFTAGVVLICVEAFSMAAGSFLSEESTEEYEQKSVVRSLIPIGGAVVMFFSYFIPYTSAALRRGQRTLA